MTLLITGALAACHREAQVPLLRRGDVFSMSTVPQPRNGRSLPPVARGSAPGVPPRPELGSAEVEFAILPAHTAG